MKALASALVVMLSGLVPIGAADAELQGHKAERVRVGALYPLAVSGTGQIDPSRSTVTVEGQATHLGHFTLEAEWMSTYVFYGQIQRSQGDFIYFGMALSTVTEPHGEVPASFSFGDGSGRYRYTRGSGIGTVIVNDDHSFSFDLDGYIWEVPPPPPCLAEPCLDS